MQPLDKGVFGPLKNQWYKTVRKHNRENPGVPINKCNFAEKLRDAYNDFYRPSIVVNSFKSSGIYPVNRAVISDDQLKTGLTFNLADDDQTEIVQHEPKKAGTSEQAGSQDINEKVFNTYVSVLKTPVKEKYKKRQEKGYNVQGVSPGYDTYVLLKSRALSEGTTVELSNKEHSSNTPGSVSQETKEANLPTPQVQEESVQGLELLANAASLMTTCETSDSHNKRKLSDKYSCQDVSPVIKETLLLPKVKIQKKKRSSILDDVPNNLTSPETIRKLALKDLEKTRQFANRERRAKSAYLSKLDKKTVKKSVKVAKTVPTLTGNEDEAMCMVCELTWGEDKLLMFGHTWIQCDTCKCWIHDHCLPVGITYDHSNNNTDFICHKCESDKV